MNGKRNARKIVSLTMSFLLTVLVTVMMIAVGFRLGICNKDIFVQNMIDNTYYETLYEGMNTNLKLLLWENSLPITLEEGVFQKSQVYIDGKNYVNSALSGKETAIKTKKIEKQLRQNIETYLEENQAVSLTDSEIEKILERTSLEYQQKTAAPLADRFYQFESRYTMVTNVVLAVSAVLCLVILFFLLKMYHRKYRAIRYMVYAMTTATIVNTLYTWYLTQSLTISNIVLGNSEYIKMADKFLAEGMKQGYYVSLAGAVATVALLLMIQTMKKKYK